MIDGIFGMVYFASMGIVIVFVSLTFFRFINRLMKETDKLVVEIKENQKKKEQSVQKTKGAVSVA